MDRWEASRKATLKGSRHLWLHGLENIPGKWARRFREFRQGATQTAGAWEAKEFIRSFWGCRDEADALPLFQDGCREAMAAGLAPVKAVARLFQKHGANILTYFGHHISKAPAEGINNRLQQFIQKTCGYRNRERFKGDVLFHLGGLGLYPEFVQ